MNNKERAAMQQALEALRLAKNSHGIMLMSDPPKDAWRFHDVDLKLVVAITALREALAEQAEQDLDTCPGCGGVADNGHDREFPPNPYYCTKCTEQADQEPVAEKNRLMTIAAIEMAVASEREACAVTAENLIPFGDNLELQKATAEDCAFLIRKRSGATSTTIKQKEPVGKHIVGNDADGYIVENLYAVPVRTKDLTDEEINKLHSLDKFWDAHADDIFRYIDFARAVIAADREKNK